jgi:HEPN domain-containing protein
LELLGEWLEKAEFFRRESRRYLQEGVYWAACFAAHQAVELYLKALQVALTGVHDFTHDLARLLEGLEEAGLQVPGDLYTLADALTPHYTMARYPGRKPVTYDKRLAERCVNYMERIIGWVKAQAERLRKAERES